MLVENEAVKKRLSRNYFCQCLKSVSSRSISRPQSIENVSNFSKTRCLEKENWEGGEGRKATSERHVQRLRCCVSRMLWFE